MSATTYMRRLASYPVMAAFIAGVLVAGLAFRLTTHKASPARIVGAPANGALGSATDTSSAGGGGLLGSSPSGAQAAGGSAGAQSTSTTAPNGGSTGGGGLLGGGGSTGPVTTSGPGSTSSNASKGTTSPHGTAAPSSKAPALPASDVGVTSTTVKLGIALQACSQCQATFGAAGGWGPDQDKGVWDAWVAYVNKNGGIAGRKVVPDYQTVDVTNASTAQAACTTWTETDHVFAAIGRDDMQSAGDVCMAVQHHTLEISGPQPKDPASVYQQSGGMLVSEAASGDRAMRAWAKGLQHFGQLQGHKPGIIVEQPLEPLAQSALIPELKALGYNVAYTAVVSSDPSQGPAQAAAQVAQFKAHGVDYVFALTNFINMGAFVNEADKIAYKPKYTVNDSVGGSTAFFYAAFPQDSWKGTSLITYGTPQNPAQPTFAKCLTLHNQLTGHHVTVPGAPLDPSNSGSNSDAQEYSVAMEACTDLNMLTSAGKVAGANLTRARLSAAIQGLGRSIVVGQGNNNGGSFGPGKTDWMDGVRMELWGPDDGSDSVNCTPGGNPQCFNLAGPPYDPEAGS